MRFLFSYGLALVIIVLIGVWMATGTLVLPGNGPGNGETPVVQVIEGKDVVDKLNLRGPRWRWLLSLLHSHPRKSAGPAEVLTAER